MARTCEHSTASILQAFGSASSTLAAGDGPRHHRLVGEDEHALDLPLDLRFEIQGQIGGDAAPDASAPDSSSGRTADTILFILAREFWVIESPVTAG